MDDAATDRPPISELRRQYDEERLYQDDRAAAEYAMSLGARGTDRHEAGGAAL
jgi:hypothetical protein